jgi:hypothetical protein
MKRHASGRTVTIQQKVKGAHRILQLDRTAIRVWSFSLEFRIQAVGICAEWNETA